MSNPVRIVTSENTNSLTGMSSHLTFFKDHSFSSICLSPSIFLRFHFPSFFDFIYIFSKLVNIIEISISDLKFIVLLNKVIINQHVCVCMCDDKIR